MLKKKYNALVTTILLNAFVFYIFNGAFYFLQCKNRLTG